MRRNVRRMVAGGIALAILLAILSGVYGIFGVHAGKAGQTVWIDIPSGASTDAIARHLAARGLVDNPLLFRAYVALTGQGDELQAGRYRFAAGQSIPQIVAELRAGAAAYETVRITIPEGFTAIQIANLLAARGVCSRQAFLDAVRHASFSYWFVRVIPRDPRIRYRLEGYLFPDTYDFLRSEPVRQVIGKMLAEMSRVLTPKLVKRAHAEGFTVAQILTIASLIEREAKLPSDRPLIASVIMNRLRVHPPMPLQMDASIEYALGRHVTDLTPHDLAVNSPYNTYTHTGLPPGPIANPGLASILAALYPAHTDYYYYVARFDGTGGNYYASTYAQQLANEVRSQRNLARLAKRKTAGH